jgi:hypothetical protein
MSGPRAPHRLRHEPQCTPLKFEEPLNSSMPSTAEVACLRQNERANGTWTFALPPGRANRLVSS